MLQTYWNRGQNGRKQVLMIPTENIMPIVKNTITASMKRNTIRGYIGWGSCNNICTDMHECLDMCEEPLSAGEYMALLEIAAYVLVSGIKLASHADSSSGMLTDVIMRTYEVIERCTKEIANKDKQVRDQALTLVIKEAKKKVFDVLLADIGVEELPEYKRQEDLIARYLLHRHLRGKAAVKAELYEHINIKELCIIAIKDAMEAMDYSEAERLCRDKLKSESAWHYRKNDPEDWNNLLFDVYKRSGNSRTNLRIMLHRDSR